MKSNKVLITITAISLFFCSKSFSQIDSTNHNGIWEIGIGYRFSSQKSNEFGSDQSGIQYNLEMSHEWNINRKHKFGFILSGQIVTKNNDLYLAPMLTWNYNPNDNYNHRFSAGPNYTKIS